MSAVFAFFYHLVPAARASRLASVHFWLTAVSGIALVVGLFFLLAGNAGDRAGRGSGVDGFYASMLLFACDRAAGDLENRHVVAARPRHGSLTVNLQKDAALTDPLSFTGVYYVHPVIWILTEWLEPLRLTPPC